MRGAQQVIKSDDFGVEVLVGFHSAALIATKQNYQLTIQNLRPAAAG